LCNSKKEFTIAFRFASQRIQVGLRNFSSKSKHPSSVQKHKMVEDLGHAISKAVRQAVKKTLEKQVSEQLVTASMAKIDEIAGSTIKGNVKASVIQNPDLEKEGVFKCFNESLVAQSHKSYDSQIDKMFSNSTLIAVDNQHGERTAQVDIVSANALSTYMGTYWKKEHPGPITHQGTPLVSLPTIMWKRDKSFGDSNQEPEYYPVGLMNNQDAMKQFLDQNTTIYQPSFAEARLLWSKGGDRESLMMLYHEFTKLVQIKEQWNVVFALVRPGKEMEHLLLQTGNWKLNADRGEGFIDMVAFPGGNRIIGGKKINLKPFVDDKKELVKWRLICCESPDPVKPDAIDFSVFKEMTVCA